MNEGWPSEVGEDRIWNGRGYDSKGGPKWWLEWSGVAWNINVGVVAKEPETAFLFSGPLLILQLILFKDQINFSLKIFFKVINIESHHEILKVLFIVFSFLTLIVFSFTLTVVFSFSLPVFFYQIQSFAILIFMR